MLRKGEKEVFNISQSSANEKDNHIIAYSNAADDVIEKNEILDLTMPKFSRKNTVLRTGAARILKNLIDFEDLDESIDVKRTVSPIEENKQNVARRGKPFRRQARRTRIINFKLPKDNPETLSKLVSEKNFCHGLLENKYISSDIKFFIQNRLDYVNYKIDLFY